MPNTYTDADLPDTVKANANMAGVADVAPETALIGINGAPYVPPSVGMRSPEMVSGLAQTGQQQAAIASSPPVAKWAATAPPASLAVSKDDFANLHTIGTQAASWLGHSVDEALAPFQDIFHEANAQYQAGKALQTQAEGQLGAGDLNGLKTAGAALLTGLNLPFAALASPGAHFLANNANTTAPNIPILTQLDAALAKVGFGANLSTPQDKYNFFRDQLSQLIAVGIGEGAGKGGEAPAPKSAPAPEAPIGPQGLFPRNGVNPVTDAVRGTLADLDAQAASTLQASVAASATHARSPQVMEEYLAQQPSERMVSVDPDKLVELSAAGHDDVFPGMDAAILDAHANGTAIEVPLSKYIAATAGKPYADELNASTVFRDGGVSVADAAEQPESAGSVNPAVSAEEFAPTETPRAQYLAEGSRADMESVVKAQFLEPLFKDPSAVGMTKGQFDRYNLKIENAISDASDKQLERAYAQIKRERTPEWKAAVAQHSAQIEQELARNPVVQARAYLAQGKGPLGEPIENPFKLDRNDPVAKYGADRGLPDRMFGKNGLSADEAAETFTLPDGTPAFANGADMVRQLADLHDQQGDLTIPEHMKAMARAEAANRARTQLGFDVSAEDMYNSASELINSPKVTDFLADELKQLAKLADLPFDLSTIKSYAADRFADMSVKDATNLRKLEGYVYKGGTKAEKALMRGDATTAFIRKQQQFIHHLELAQAHKFIKEYGKATTKWAKIAKKRSVKSIDQDYMDALHGELQQYGYKVPQANLKYNHLKWEQEQADLNNAMPAPVEIPKTDPRSMTVQQFRDLADRITNMVHLGRDARTALVNGQKVALDDLVQEAKLAAVDVTRKAPLDTVVRKKSLSTFGDLMNMEASRPEFQFDKLDENNPNGVFNRVLMHGANDAHAVGVALKGEILDKFNEMYDAISDDERASWGVKLPEGHGLLDPITGRELTLFKRDLMSIMANMGTEANRGHLEENGWGWDRDAYTNVVAQHLSPESADFVQNILNLLSDHLWPKIAESERAMSGLVPERQAAIPITLPDGREYAGGYFPLQRDHERSGLPGNADTDANDIFKRRFYDAATNKGYTIKRTGAAYPVSLNFQNTLFDHINDVIKRIAYGQYVQSANRFIRHPEIRKLLSEVHGPNMVPNIRKWMQRQVGMGATDPRTLSAVDNFLRTMRENFYLTKAAFRVSIMAEHATTFAQAAAITNTKQVAAGYAKWIMDWNRAKDFAHESSPFMANRVNAVDRELRDIHDDMQSNRKLLPSWLSGLESTSEFVHKAGHGLFTFINHYTVAVPHWIGAYDAARGGTAELRGTKLEVMDHERAVRYADKVVSEAHGTGSEKDLAGIQSSSSEAWKLVNMWYQYHANQLQLAKGAVNQSLRGRTTNESRAGLKAGLLALIVSPLVGALASGYNRDMLFGPRANSKTRALWTGQTVIGGNARFVPGAESIINMIEKHNKTGRWDFTLSPIAAVPETIAKAASALAHLTGRGTVAGKLEKFRKAQGYKNTAETLGYAGLLPGGTQVGNILQGTADLGKPGNKHPIQGIINGPYAEKDH